MNLIKSFDISILGFLNQFAQKSRFFDHVASGFEGESLVKGGVLTAFLWWAWFRHSSDQTRDRSIVLSGGAGGVVALAAARFAAFCLPYRERPIFVPSLHFRPPYYSTSATLINWSSFPSDHAALYFCLATVVFFISRRAGLLAFVWTSLFICLPRLYFGDHYPSDILGGAFIGIATAVACVSARIRDAIARFPLQLVESAPGTAYTALYLASFLLANNFDPIRKLGPLLFHSLRTHGAM